MWSRWVGERDKAARDALILLHAPWARLVARDIYLRVKPRDIEWGEFAQNATLGLIEATDRYDPARGVEFRVFARHRVRGAVFNGLRQLWEHSRPPVRISDVDRAESLNEEGDPLDSFASWAVGLGIGHLLDVAALSEPAPHPSSPYAELERDQMCVLLRRAIELLPERERTILTWHYFQHVPFIEIANHLEVTKGRVSQLHKQAIERLRVCLREFAESYSY
ncbi:MAG: sigma-70 family RNA polymerase sigma factor [Rhodanobacteraceae bacterium]